MADELYVRSFPTAILDIPCVKATALRLCLRRSSCLLSFHITGRVMRYKLLGDKWASCQGISSWHNNNSAKRTRATWRTSQSARNCSTFIEATATKRGIVTNGKTTHSIRFFLAGALSSDFEFFALGGHVFRPSVTMRRAEEQKPNSYC